LSDPVRDLDEIDKGILLTLVSNCRTPYETLARKLGITATAVKKRVKKLIDTGVIVRFTVELTTAMVDGGTFLALISTDGSEREDEFVKLIGSYGMAREVGSSSAGLYTAIGTFVGADGLRKFGSLARSIKCVTKVELHTLTWEVGKKTEFTNLQLKVLRCLVDDPRMSIEDISKRSGLTAKRTRTILNQLIESDALILGMRLRLSGGDNVSFLSRIEWDEKLANLGQVLDSLTKMYPIEYWFPMISAAEPTVFAVFVVKSLSDVDRITKEISRVPFVKSSMTLLGKPNEAFPDILDRRLEEMLKEAGL